MAPILALLSAALYGTADFLGGMASRRATVFAAAVAAGTVGLVLLAVALPLVPAAPLTRSVVLWSLGAGATGAAGVGLLYYGFAMGRVSVVAPVSAVCSIAIPVMVGLGLGERPTMLALIGILLAVISVALISRHDDPATASGQRDHSLAIALASGVAIGGFLVCLARSGTQSGVWPLLISRCISTLGLALVARARRVSIALPRAAVPAAVGCGMLDVTANACYLFAARGGSLGLIATLASLYPASTVLLARVVLGERLKLAQSLGLACAAVAIVLITSR
ncbi:MAG TPA: EamA family transporter [Gemmatimonadales bacterium]|nr:EamA family transporter [Gemmatimonadales bacterium]